MSLSIQQDFKYKDNDYWRWWVWLEGSDDELDAVDHVIYMLHPTFYNPVRTVKDRSTKFKLKTAGWGVFPLRVKVVRKDGEVETLRHDLVLKYPNGTATTA